MLKMPSSAINLPNLTIAISIEKAFCGYTFNLYILVYYVLHHRAAKALHELTDPVSSVDLLIAPEGRSDSEIDPSHSSKALPLR